MVAKYYRAHFYWFIDSMEIPEGMIDSLINEKGAEELLDRKFMEAQNKGADALNEHYEEWNKEYDALYGTKPGDEDSYYRFISQKQNEILKKVPDDFFELFTDPEFGECSICGRLKNNKNMKVQVLFTAVE